ncbi:hypothetical protein LguiA_002796 [Lonicera macranthoides]
MKNSRRCWAFSRATSAAFSLSSAAWRAALSAASCSSNCRALNDDPLRSRTRLTPNPRNSLPVLRHSTSVMILTPTSLSGTIISFNGVSSG